MSARIDFLTGEYPPLRGGVADHTALVAAALVERGAEVHVWTGGTEGSTTEPDGVHVHRIAGVFGRPDLARLRDAMAAAGEPARLVLQWVPHAFGYRGINLPLATWLLARARRRPMDVLVHEPGLAPFDGGVRHFIAAAIQWSMLAAVLMRARRTWVTTPAWTPRVQPFVSHPLQWVGVPSNVPAVATTAQVERVRKRLAPSGQLLVGHFGTHGDRAREHWSVVLATLRALAREGVRKRRVEPPSLVVPEIPAVFSVTKDIHVQLRHDDRLAEERGDTATSRRAGRMPSAIALTVCSSAKRSWYSSRAALPARVRASASRRSVASAFPKAA